jgi:hypothetical protein
VHHPLVPRDVAQDTTPLRHVALPKAVVAALLGHGATDGGHDPQSVASTPRSNHRPRIQATRAQARKKKDNNRIAFCIIWLEMVSIGCYISKT